MYVNPWMVAGAIAVCLLLVGCIVFLFQGGRAYRTALADAISELDRLTAKNGELTMRLTSTRKHCGLAEDRAMGNQKRLLLLRDEFVKMRSKALFLKSFFEDSTEPDEAWQQLSGTERQQYTDTARKELEQSHGCYVG